MMLLPPCPWLRSSPALHPAVVVLGAEVAFLAGSLGGPALLSLPEMSSMVRRMSSVLRRLSLAPDPALVSEASFSPRGGEWG